MTKKERNELRGAIAGYMAAEGCGCCENTDKHERAAARIAKMLNAPQYEDFSGYDFFRYETGE